jgi:hypothetical protein
MRLIDPDNAFLRPRAGVRLPTPGFRKLEHLENIGIALFSGLR